MQKILAFLLILCYYHGYDQMIPLRGVVSLQNSKFLTGSRQFISLAQVTDDFDKAQPDLTDSHGKFTLNYINTPDKSSVSFHVKKPPLEVVNLSDLHATAGQLQVVSIYMASPESVAEFRKQIYNVGKTAAEKNLEWKLIEKTKGILALQKSDSLIEQKAQELAAKYSVINLDDASPTFQAAFSLFQAGQLDSALHLLSEFDIENEVRGIAKEKKKVDLLKQEVHNRDSALVAKTANVFQLLQFKAGLYELHFEFDSAERCYQNMLSVDTLNLENIVAYAKFSMSQKRNRKAIQLFEKALDREYSTKCVSLKFS
jgi:hypothetical protein